MSLKPLTSWVEEQYDHIEHYFWSPQEIGRKTHGPKRTFAEWRDKLASHSTSMKHFLTQYFVLCPQSVTDQVLSKLCDKTCVGLSLVNPYHGVNLEGIVQPNMVFYREKHLILGKIQISGHSYVDHIVKLAVAALKYGDTFGSFESIDLFILATDTTYSKVVRPIKDNPDLETTISRAIDGIKGLDVWKEAALPSWLSKQDETTKTRLIDTLNKMVIHFVSYNDLSKHLLEVDTNETAQRLTHDLVQELRNRHLILTEYTQ